MPDVRVKHFWDGELEVARWFAKQVDGYEGVSWDMYYLYRSGCRMENCSCAAGGFRRYDLS